MSYSPEAFGTETLQTPEERAERFARAITSLVVNTTFSEEMRLPDDPNYTVVLDDPRGHFPLQHISPLNIGAELGSRQNRIYAVSSVNDPRIEEVRSLHKLQVELKRSQLPADQAQAQQYRHVARIIQRSIPKPRQFTFKTRTLADTLEIIRPIDDPKYFNIG